MCKAVTSCLGARSKNILCGEFGMDWSMTLTLWEVRCEKSI